jgi:hypothetical protein
LPEESLTTAFRLVAKGEPTVVLCGVPADAEIEAGAPDVLVSSKTVPVVMPDAVATTW